MLTISPILLNLIALVAFGLTLGVLAMLFIIVVVKIALDVMQ
jgi:hypothetical protein